MLLLACGLHAALDGTVTGPAATAQPPGGPAGPLPSGAPSQFDAADLAVYGRIRAALHTPILNTIWRRLAADGLLADAWPALEPATVTTHRAAARLQVTAYEAAVGLPWTPVASPAALDGSGVGDAAPGMAIVLDAYVKTLPRVLALVADL